MRIMLSLRARLMNSSMKLELTECYLCNHSQSRPWASENGFSAVRCQECGLVYLDRRPAADRIDQASRIGYHDTKNGTLNTIGRYSAKKERNYREKISQMADTIGINSKKCRWLDVGAGHGEFVSALAKNCAPDSEILGIEPSGPKVKEAQKKGLPI